MEIFWIHIIWPILLESYTLNAENSFIFRKFIYIFRIHFYISNSFLYFEFIFIFRFYIHFYNSFLYFENSFIFRKFIYIFENSFPYFEYGNILNSYNMANSLVKLDIKCQSFIHCKRFSYINIVIVKLLHQNFLRIYSLYFSYLWSKNIMDRYFEADIYSLSYNFYL